MNGKGSKVKLLELPLDLRKKIRHGMYGGVVQYYIDGVDGTLAQLGENLKEVNKLRETVDNADVMHKKLMNGRV